MAEHIPFDPAHNSMDKIRLKGGPKQFKSGTPGLAGVERVQRQVASLTLAAARLERKGGPGSDYARALKEALQAFTATHVP
jgi:hypothetical protein